MEGVIEQLLILCNQLVVIGADEPKVLIAGMLIVAAVAITIVVCVVAIILCIPYTVIMCIVQLCQWLWRRKHPPKPHPVKQHPQAEEVNYIPKRQPQRSVHTRERHTKPAPASELPPVYPDWMQQKSGRLL